MGRIEGDTTEFTPISGVQGSEEQPPWIQQLGQMARRERRLREITEFTTIWESALLGYKDLKSNHHGFNN
jgi:hypothetical protein